MKERQKEKNAVRRQKTLNFKVTKTPIEYMWNNNVKIHAFQLL